MTASEMGSRHSLTAFFGCVACMAIFYMTSCLVHLQARRAGPLCPPAGGICKWPAWESWADLVCCCLTCGDGGAVVAPRVIPGLCVCQWRHPPQPCACHLLQLFPFCAGMNALWQVSPNGRGLAFFVLLIDIGMFQALWHGSLRLQISVAANHWWQTTACIHASLVVISSPLD